MSGDELYMSPPPHRAEGPRILRSSGRLQRVPRPLRPIVRVCADTVKRVYRLVRAWSRFVLPSGRRFAATWRWGRKILADIRRRRHETGLTVAVEITAFWESLTGIGWYLHQLLEQLADRPDLRLRLYGPSIFAHPNDAGPTVALPHGRAIERVFYEVPDDLLLDRNRLISLLRTVEPFFVAADANRVLFAPNFIAPRQFAVSRRPLVASVHDMTIHRVPWTMLEDTRLAHEHNLDCTMARARAILTLSETVRAEILERGHQDPRTVHAIHLAGRLDRVACGELPAEVPARFVLHVGTIEPRKNVTVLLEAWRRLRDEMLDAPALVLCGKVGWQREAVELELDKAAREGWLVHLGYTSDTVLRVLYERAVAVVCPSVYEGFGLPLVEAMAAKTPIVCSDIPVFREVAGDAALFVPPDDAAGWARQIACLASNPEPAGHLRARGQERVKAFSWRQTADRTLAVWSDVAAGA
jgi:glycosyltransferase involved in cell wall biosynthesis